jgi:NADH-quinone oxidoreductase subunit A
MIPASGFNVYLRPRTFRIANDCQVAEKTLECQCKGCPTNTIWLLMMETVSAVPVFLLFGCVAGLAVALFAIAALLNPRQYVGPVQKMPYESGMDPIHDTRRRFDVRFHLIAIAFLVFDVEVLFLYPWAVAAKRPDVPVAQAAYPALPGGLSSAAGQTGKTDLPYDISAAVHDGLASDRNIVFAGVMVFIALLALGFVYDWRKGVFQWR